MLCASASLFDTRILNCENLICRGIEAVITGLTRNQFVDNTTRGFESLPLRQRFNLTHSGWIEPFFLAQREEMNLFRFCDKRFAYRRHKLTLRKRAFTVSASRGSPCFHLNFSGCLCISKNISFVLNNHKFKFTSSISDSLFSAVKTE